MNIVLHYTPSDIITGALLVFVVVGFIILRWRAG
jgi:hypothetical protein